MAFLIFAIGLAPMPGGAGNPHRIAISSRSPDGNKRTTGAS